MGYGSVRVWIIDHGDFFVGSREWVIGQEVGYESGCGLWVRDRS